jgi:FkbM family methyltransferase
MLFKRGYENLIFALSARNSVLIDFYHRYIYKPKPGSLACFYNQLSQLKPGLFVIQVGANDGITHDPIHKYIKRDNWRGVLIEPQETVYRSKLFPLYRRNKQIFVENISVNEANGLMDFHKLSFCNDRWASGLSTFHRPTLQSKIDSGEIERLAKRYGVSLPGNKSEFISTIKVEAKSFSFIREKYNIQHVDVLQIDTEGFDFEIVKLYDLKENKAAVVVFESSHLNEKQYSETQNYFESNGYALLRVKGDSIGIHKSFADGLSLIEKCAIN